MIQRRLPVLALLLTLVSLAAGPPPREDPEEKQFRAVRQAVLDAFDKGEIDELLKHVRTSVVTTWQNAETVRGHDGVRKFFEKTRVGDDRTVRRLTSKLTVDGPSLLFNDKSTAVSVGGMENHFDLPDGKSYKLESRWTATLVKDQDKWQIVAFHISTNVFDNGVQGVLLRTWVMWTGIGAAVLGLLLGALGSSIFRRKAPA